MHRFFVAPEQCRSQELVLSEREAHHALRVVRVRPGDRVSVLNGAGQELLCEVAGTTRETVRLAVLEQRAISPPPCWITLIQAVPKGRLLESIIQKATELGVHRLVPLLTERVIPHLASGDASLRAQRWRAVAVEALKQCGSPWLPQIDEPVSPQQFLQRQEAFDLALIASLHPGARHPRTWFQAFHARHNRLPRSVCIWVGPEGDFTPTESELIQTAGVLPITLGPRVLRTETAAVYCLSVVNYELASSANKEGGLG